MKTLTVKNLTKSYSTKALFENVSFSVSKGDRIAIIGQNGSGKSTLLKILSSKEAPDSGKVIKERVAIEYIAQEFTGDAALTILEYLDTMQAKPRVFEIIKKFGVITEDQVANEYLHALSGGQRRIVEIAGVLSKSPMFLCIDEPENHLDIKARMVLSEILQHYWGAVLFVSHDRYLINEISNKILSLQDQTGVLTTGKSYEQFLDEEALKTGGEIARWNVEAKALKKLEGTVKMLGYRSSYNPTQSKTYQMKKRQLAEAKRNLG